MAGLVRAGELTVSAVLVTSGSRFSSSWTLHDLRDFAWLSRKSKRRRQDRLVDPNVLRDSTARSAKQGTSVHRYLGLTRHGLDHVSHVSTPPPPPWSLFRRLLGATHWRRMGKKSFSAMVLEEVHAMKDLDES